MLKSPRTKDVVAWLNQTFAGQHTVLPPIVGDQPPVRTQSEPPGDTPIPEPDVLDGFFHPVDLNRPDPNPTFQPTQIPPRLVRDGTNPTPADRENVAELRADQPDPVAEALIRVEATAFAHHTPELAGLTPETPAPDSQIPEERTPKMPETTPTPTEAFPEAVATNEAPNLIPEPDPGDTGATGIGTNDAVTFVEPDVLLVDTLVDSIGSNTAPHYAEPRKHPRQKADAQHIIAGGQVYRLGRVYELTDAPAKPGESMADLPVFENAEECGALVSGVKGIPNTPFLQEMIRIAEMTAYHYTGTTDVIYLPFRTDYYQGQIMKIHGMNLLVEPRDPNPVYLTQPIVMCQNAYSSSERVLVDTATPLPIQRSFTMKGYSLEIATGGKTFWWKKGVTNPITVNIYVDRDGNIFVKEQGYDGPEIQHHLYAKAVVSNVPKMVAVDQNLVDQIRYLDGVGANGQPIPSWGNQIVGWPRLKRDLMWLIRNQQFLPVLTALESIRWMITHHHIPNPNQETPSGNA